MSTVTALRDDSQPESNFRRVVAGATVTAAEILAGWQRTIKICMPDGAAPAGPARIELPPVRQWDRDLTIVDVAGNGFLLHLGAGDELYGDINTDSILHRVVRLSPLLSGRADEPDAWAATA